MKREIYEVYAKAIDSNGNYETLNGYPKIYDSHQNDDDCEKAKSKAYGEFHSILGAMYNRTDCQCQFVMIIRANDGLQIERASLGSIADILDPTYEVTVISGSGSGSYTKGHNVIITADIPVEGIEFDAWDGADNLIFTSGNVNSSYAAFRMPENPVTLTATYREILSEEIPEEESEESIEESEVEEN